MKLKLPCALLAIALLSPILHAGEAKAAASKAETKRDSKSKKESAKEDADSGPIRLQSIFVGDKEQPAISYFIPWQGIGAPDKLFWNVEEKHDKALENVDREIMLRSIQLYDQLELESPGE